MSNTVFIMIIRRALRLALPHNIVDNI